MNPWQMALQIREELRTVTWPGGSTKLVFGTGVHVFAGTPTEDQIPARFPWALVGVDGGTADESHPEFLEQSFTILIAANVAGDAIGEQALVGGPTSELGISGGRGAMELAERARSAIQNLTGADGAKVMVTAQSTGVPTLLAGRHYVLDETTVTALCTSALHYAAPQELSHDGSTWTWEGAHCSDRFDFKQYRIYSHTSIMNGPGTAATGTPILLDTVTTASFTGAATSSLFYHVFADYSARQQTGVIEGSSGVEVGSYKEVP